MLCGTGSTVESDHDVSPRHASVFTTHLPDHALPWQGRKYAGPGPVFGIECVLLPDNNQRRLKPVIEATQKDEAMSIPPPSLNPQTGPYTILIVDDDPDMRLLCATTLVSAGFNVLQAAGSTEAMEICVRHGEEIHLALVDVMLSPPDPQWMTERTSWPRVHGHKLILNLLAKRKGLPCRYDVCPFH